MRLPENPNRWTSNHLKQALAQAETAFARYESADPGSPRAEALYAKYQRLERQVEDLRLALGVQPTAFFLPTH